MGTHYDGDERVVRALDTFIKLARASSAIERELARALQREGLTQSQLGVLQALHHLGPMCQRAMGEKLLLSGGNVTTVVTNLQTRGLVRRVRGERDRRFVTLELTEAGRALIDAVFPAHAARIAELLGVLTPQDQERLGALAKALGKGVSRRASPPSWRADEAGAGASARAESPERLVVNDVHCVGATQHRKPVE